MTGALASVTIAVAISSGCGLDAVGSLVVADAGLRNAPLVEAAPPAPPDAATSDAGDAAPPDECADPSLVLCVPFDGVPADRAHGQAIQVSGLVTFVAGIHGEAVLLDPTSALTVADGPDWTYTKLTVETWVRVDALPADGGRSGLLDKDGSFGVFVYPDGTVDCVMSGVASAKVLATVGTWVHVACVNDGAATSLYADGVLQTSVDAGAVSQTTALAAIGNNSPNLGNPLVGALDLLRVYSRAKTAAEIAADAKR